MKKGEPAPRGLKEWVVRLGGRDPRPTNRVIRQSVKEKFGVTIDDRTIGRYCEAAGVPRSTRNPPVPSARSTLLDGQIERHHGLLLTVLNDLQGIEVFPLRDHAIQNWWTRPEEPSWPVAKGRVYRNKDGSLSVRLSAEDLLEWEYLQRHLEGDPVWKAIEEWKLAMAGDLAARLRLMDSIATRIKAPREQGSLGLPIGPDLGFIAVNRSEVTSYFLFTIYDQVLSRALGLRLSPKRREEFDYRDPGYPEVVSLGGIPVVRSTDTEVRSRAVSFLLEVQEGLGGLLDVQAAVAAYHEAEARTAELKRCLRKIILALGLPPGSVCDGCKAWFGIGGI